MATARIRMTTNPKLRGEDRPAVPMSKVARALIDMLGIVDADIDDILRVTIHPDAIEVEVYPEGPRGRFFSERDGTIAVDRIHFPVDKDA